MEYFLENDLLKVTVNSLGAEVTSVVAKASGQELWWCGDAAFWKGHSPILFPACGGLWNGEYRLDGKPLKMQKHGFAKFMEFEKTEDTLLGENDFSISLTLCDNEETMKSFPFRFRLTITYTLRESVLECDAEVTNLTEGHTMHYQLGGHPATALPDYAPDEEIIGYLAPCNMRTDNLSVVRAGEQGCWGPERFKPKTDEQGLIPISVETFANEALIFDNSQFQSMIIYRADGETELAEVYFDAPVCLVWQMTGLLCPYVCVEPWFGLCDRQGYTMDLDYRPYSQHAMEGDTNSHFLWGINFVLQDCSD